MRRVIWWIVPVTLLALAAYQLSLVLRDHTDQNVVGFVAILVMFVGAGLAIVSIWRDTPSWGVALLAPSAAAFAIARFYTYDPYYGSAVRRYSDGGLVPPGWMFFLVAADVGVGILYRFVPELGAIPVALGLLATAFTTLIMVGGH